jgi:hypothetical protein
LTLNMAYGTFYLNPYIYRYDIQKEYDAKTAAATIFIGSTTAVRGSVNCFPKIIEAGTVVEEARDEVSMLPAWDQTNTVIREE